MSCDARRMCCSTITRLALLAAVAILGVAAAAYVLPRQLLVDPRAAEVAAARVRTENRALTETAAAERALAEWQAAREALHVVREQLADEARTREREALAEQLARLEAHEQSLRAAWTKLATARERAMPATSADKPESPERTLLEALRSEEQRLAVHLRDNHPQLIALRQRIADLDSSPQTSQPIERPAPLPPPAAHAGAINVDAVLPALPPLKRDSEQQHEPLSNESNALAALERKAAQAEAEYERQLQRLAQQPSEQHSAPDCQSSGLSPSGFTPPLAPFSIPPAAVLIAGGLVLAALVSALVASASRRSRQIIRHSDEIPQLLGLPLVGTLRRTEQCSVPQTT